MWLCSHSNAFRLPSSADLGLASQSRSQYVLHFCDGVTTLINHLSITTMSTLMKVGAINWGARRPIHCAYFHGRRHGSYRDLVDQSCNTVVTKVMCTYWERDCIT